ncbi:MAG TPA: cytochrome c [Anaeromyxobacteraceae bacterium]|nr:cytochrome c [Anaeromyxobacteraceae bacterium]
MRSKWMTSLVAAALLAAPAARAADAPKKTPQLVEKGKTSFATNCASCHGPKGEGDGVAAAALKPRPANLLTASFKGGAKPAQVFETLGKGVPGTAMVAFKHLPEEERWALAYYVTDLRAKAPRTAKK